MESLSSFWWIAAGVLVAVELATGTFYLLMLALGALAAAVAQWAGMPASTQVTVAALVGGGATAGWHFLRTRRAQVADACADPDVQLDVGQTLEVPQWSADGTCRVHYRGSQWDAVHHGSAPPQSGLHRITAVRGNRLELERAG